MANWERIVSQYGPLVWATAYRLLGSQDDACDCFQETFLVALEVSRRERVRNLPGLLRHLATARALDGLRRRRQVASGGHLADWSTIPCGNPGPVQQAADAELAARLRRALAQLPPRQAEALCARYLEGLSYRRIGRRLNLRVGAVSALLHRAHERLRKMLEAEEEAETDEVHNG